MKCPYCKSDNVMFKTINSMSECEYRCHNCSEIFIDPPRIERRIL